MTKWVVGIVAVLLLVGGVVFYGMTRIVKDTPAYQDAARFVLASEELNAFTGADTRLGWLPSGTIAEEGSTGEASFRIAAKGRRASTRVHVKLVKGGDRWIVKTATYETPDEDQVILPVPPAGEPSRVTDARALRAKHDLAGALALLDEELLEDPTNASALYWRALVRIDLGDASQADADLRAAMAADPDYRPAHERLASRAARAGEWDDVISIWSPWLSRHGNDADALHERATAFRKLDDIEAANEDDRLACQLGNDAACHAGSGAVPQEEPKEPEEDEEAGQARSDDVIEPD